MGMNCKTCKRLVINTKTKICVSVSSIAQRHPTPACTALSPVAINGINELDMSALLHGSTCVEKQQSRQFRTLQNTCYSNRQVKKNQRFLSWEKLKSMEMPLTSTVENNMGNAMRSCEKANAAVMAVDKSTGKQLDIATIPTVIKFHDNPNASFRLQKISQNQKTKTLSPSKVKITTYRSWME